MMNVLKAFDHFLEKFSRYGLITSMFGILIFSVAAILFRWSGKSVLWLEPLVRHLVFLCAFLGGSLATSKNVHIRIDLFSRVLEAAKIPALQWIHRSIINFFCLLITGFLTHSAWNFFLVEKEFGAPSFLNIHSSYLVGIIPFGMGLITLRFLVQFLMGILSGEHVEHSRV